jgi:hypothetical protein
MRNKQTVFIFALVAKKAPALKAANKALEVAK